VFSLVLTNWQLAIWGFSSLSARSFGCVEMSTQPRFAYIDAFAGTGYQAIREAGNPAIPLLPELLEEEPKRFLEGSAAIALQIEPPFDSYIFIEKDPKRFIELQHLKTDYPQREEQIRFVNEDANIYLTKLCRNSNWKSHRAVLFLDPFGMQVDWETISAIAATEAIDLWYLFPLGVAVNRLLKRHGEIDESLRKRLNSTFGSEDWYQAFYRPNTQASLFGEENQFVKVADFDAISGYFVKRLETLFPGVAQNPLPLFNSKNVPLFLLCFASANKKGASTAIRIAQHVLRR
jgi:three-Cys-motif partner protein